MALGLIVMLALGTACGKYGKPRRTTEEAPAATADAGATPSAGSTTPASAPESTHRDETDPRVDGNRR